MTFTQLQDTLYNELIQKYQKSFINKAELASELDCSVSAVNNYISKGYGIPQYKKLGNAKNARVLFPITCVAEYMSNVQLVA